VTPVSPIVPPVIRHIDCDKDGSFELTLREAVAASLLQQTHDRISGAGGFGDVILDGKPSKVLSAAFLLPANKAGRPGDEVGQANDAINPIHVGTVGMSFQVAGEGGGEILVQPTGSVYVRALPSVEEMRTRPIPFVLNDDLRVQLNELRREFVSRAESENVSVIREKGRNSAEWRKIKGDAIKAARDELGRRIGNPVQPLQPISGEQPGILEEVPIGAGPPVVDSTEIDQIPEQLLQNSIPIEQDPDGDLLGTGCLTVETGTKAPPADHLVKFSEIPQKWIRLEVDFPSITLQLDWSSSELEDRLRLYSEELSAAVASRVSSWEVDEDPRIGGALWAMPMPTADGSHRIRPSQAANWERTLQAFAANRDLTHPRPSVRLELEADIAADPLAPDQRTVRVILRNASELPDPLKPQSRYYEHGLFQVRVDCEMTANLHVALVMERIKPSYRWNEWLSYPGIGLNAAIEQRATVGGMLRLSTCYLPIYAQPRIEPFQLELAPTFDRLSERDGGLPVLEAMASEYRVWIERSISKEPWKRGLQQERDSDDIEAERRAFEQDADKWRAELDRLERGIKILRHSAARLRDGALAQDPEVIPLTAWRAMNSSFGGGRHREWRLFQVAFILGSIAGLVTRIPYWAGRHDILTPSQQEEDDATAQLLYFPTGGGKSEAFYGVLVFAMFLDRLRGKHLGITAMVRYPLRLLTAQQANRFAKVAAAAERTRRRLRIEGVPFQVGFWVGSGNTPNSPHQDGFGDLPTFESGRFDELVLQRSSPEYRSTLRWKRLTECPFCGSRESIGIRSRREARTRRLAHICTDPRCDWNKWHGGIEPLPFHVMDTDIYAYAPTVLLGTVDKMAMIGHSALTIARVFGMLGFAPWQYMGGGSQGGVAPGVGRLVHPHNHDRFAAGPERAECRRLWPVYSNGERIFYDPYPSILVQDEAHLLEESLGTFDGLFETMFESALFDLAALQRDVVCAIQGRPRRFKVIAASATVSEPERQIEMIYQRSVDLFPYPGETLYESFFARLAKPSPMDQGREQEQNVEVKSPVRRFYASMPTNGKPHTSATVSILSAFHLSASEFFDRLLSKQPADRLTARRQLVDHLPIGPWTRWWGEAVARASDDHLAEAADLHRIALCYVTNKKGGDNVKAALWEFTSRDHKRAKVEFGNGGGIRTALITGAIEMEAIQNVVDEARPVWKPGDPFERNRDMFDALRGVVATSAISHGVDVDRFNTMFFAGLPSKVAEYIQASSRVGRAHVGFSVIVPTPQAQRDTRVVEIHDIFHRFLERMVQPAAVDRWAAEAIHRVLSSALMVKACAVDHYRSLSTASEPEKARCMPSDQILKITGRYRDDIIAAVSAIEDYLRRSIGLGEEGSRFEPSSRPWYQNQIRDRARRWVQEMSDPLYRTAGLRNFFQNVGAPLPMTSLRDVDESGSIRVARYSVHGRFQISPKLVREVMRTLRQGGAAWGEGEDDTPDTTAMEREDA
jgi:hypothetical protein